MLGAMPIASMPIAAARSLVAVQALLAATGGLTFGGSAAAGARVHLSASGGLMFGGSAFLSAKAYRSATGGITFGGSPLLTVAGKPVVFTAAPQSFEFRTEQLSPEFVSLTASFDFRGIGR